ncbi:ribosome maturation factor [Sesbania bispinosa]|nr:ribosome maturation factor [Sesbania bispinosa]
MATVANCVPPPWPTAANAPSRSPMHLQAAHRFIHRIVFAPQPPRQTASHAVAAPSHRHGEFLSFDSLCVS